MFFFCFVYSWYFKGFLNILPGLHLKISRLANTGTFTEILINVYCPYKQNKEKIFIKHF